MLLSRSESLEGKSTRAPDFVYLIDFGIAANLLASRRSFSVVSGTAAYMAPERFIAGGDHRVDVYALGCVLHQLLTGQTPFTGDFVQLMYAHTTAPPPRPSTFMPDLPPELDAVVATALAKDPDQRYSTTRELSTAADSVLVRRITQRREARSGPTTGAQPPRAVFEQATRTAADGNPSGARELYERVIQSQHPHWAPKAMLELGMVLEELDDLAGAGTLYRQAVESGHSDQAPRAMVSMAVLREKQGDLDGACRWAQRAIESRHPSQAPQAMVNLGVLLIEQDDPDGARELYERAIASGHVDEAPRAMVNLAVLLMDHEQWSEARQWFEQATRSEHPHETPRATLGLGWLMRELDDPGSAREFFESAVQSQHPETSPQAMVNLGALLEDQGYSRTARDWYERAIASGHQTWALQAAARLAKL